MKDPYETLGVNRSATDKEIKDSFKKLARKFHPDLHPGDKEAEAKFKDISAAKDFLDDKEKRRRFDAGEIDANGAERPQERFYRDFADGPAYASHATQDGFANNKELEEFLSRALRAGDVRAIPITAAGIHRQWHAATLKAAGSVAHVDAFIDLLANRAMPARRRPLAVRSRPRPRRARA